MRSGSLSVQTTWWPSSAKHVPVTKPTYPQPITEIRTLRPPKLWPIGRPSLLHTIYQQGHSSHHFPYRARLLHEPLGCTVTEARKSNNRLHNGAGGKENAEKRLG